MVPNRSVISEVLWEAVVTMRERTEALIMINTNSATSSISSIPREVVTADPTIMVKDRMEVMVSLLMCTTTPVLSMVEMEAAAATAVAVVTIPVGLVKGPVVPIYSSIICRTI